MPNSVTALSRENNEGEKLTNNDGKNSTTTTRTIMSVWTLTGIVLLIINLLSFISFQSFFVSSFRFSGSGTMSEAQTATTTKGVLHGNGYSITTMPRNCDSVYQPSKVEDYILKNSQELGFEGITREAMVSGCNILWRNASFELRDELHKFIEELEEYNELLNAFVEKKQSEGNKISIVDALREQEKQNKHHQAAQQHRNLCSGSQIAMVDDICLSLELNPSKNVTTTTATGLVPSIFSSQDLLSYSTSGSWMEPLLPPMRHPNFCTKPRMFSKSLSYLVHDFAAFC